jgi:hypothetical protein
MAAPIIPAGIIDGLPVGGNGVVVGTTVIPPFVCVCINVGVVVITDVIISVGVGVRVRVNVGEIF